MSWPGEPSPRRNLNHYQRMKTSLKVLLVASIAAAVPAVLGAATAEENWTKQCAKCHGADGKATGPMGKKLHLKDYTTAEAQAAMTDEEMTNAIKNGEKDDSGKMKMPAYGEKLSDDEIAGLVAYIRAMGPQA